MTWLYGCVSAMQGMITEKLLSVIESKMTLQL